MATQPIVIKSLINFMSCMKLDIACTVSKLSKCASIPVAEHLKRIVRIFRFTHSYELHYTIYLAILDINWIFDMKKI